MSQLEQNQQLVKSGENQMNKQKEMSQNNINPQKNDNGEQYDKNIQSVSGQNGDQDQENSDNEREGLEQIGEEQEQMRDQQEMNNEQKQNEQERLNQEEQEKQNIISNQQQQNEWQIQNNQQLDVQNNEQFAEKGPIDLNIKDQEDKRKMNNQSPFMWGQQNQQQNVERTYQHLFINSNYKSQELFIHTKQLSKQIRQQKQSQNRKMQNKIIKPPVPDDVDIWSDIKSSMLQKSRLSQQTKSINTQSKPKSQAKGYQKNKIQSERIRRRKNSDRQKLSSPSIFKQQKKVVALKIGRKLQQNEDKINNIQEMRKIIAEKVKKWRSQQKQIQGRRINKFQIEREKLKMEQQKQIEEQRLKKEIEKNQRVKVISQKLKKKKKRGQASTSPQRQDKEAIKKVRKSNTQKNLKKNQKGQKIEKKQKNDQNEAIKISSPKFINKQLQQQDFSIHWNRKVDVFQQQKQKLMRRKYFEQRIREVPISVNSNKKLKILIEVDKSSNPLKYQLLQRKGMSDAQIFHSSKQFKVPENPKKIGKQYLQQIRQKNKSVDLRRYMSQQSILNLPKYERNWKSPLMETIMPKEQNTNITVSKILNKYSQKKKEILREDDQYLMSIKK